jgi:hypothetical protein
MHTYIFFRSKRAAGAAKTGRQRVGRRWNARLHTHAGATLAWNDNQVHARDAMTPNANQSAELAGLSARGARGRTDERFSLSLSPLCERSFLRTAFVFISTARRPAMLIRIYRDIIEIYRSAARFVYCLFIYLSFDLSGQSNEKDKRNHTVCLARANNGQRRCANKFKSGLHFLSGRLVCLRAIRQTHFHSRGQKLCIIDMRLRPWELALQSVPGHYKF